MNQPQAYTAILLAALIVVEFYLSYRDQTENFEYRDTLTNLRIGAIGLIVNLGMKLMYAGIFTEIGTWSLTDIQLNWFTGVVLFLIVDFQFYVFHLLGHKNRFFWAFHVVHHSSAKYNFTTALRLPFANTVFRYGFLGVPVLIGFDVVDVFAMDAGIVSITFLHHTEKVGRLGWLEYIFNTPAHHRIHHASNPEYIDKNMGGVLILWDKLFGTFAAETARPVYGITKPVGDNTVWNTLTHEFRDLFADIHRHPDLMTQIRFFMKGPSWKPAANEFDTEDSGVTVNPLRRLHHWMKESKRLRLRCYFGERFPKLMVTPSQGIATKLSIPEAKGMNSP